MAAEVVSRCATGQRATIVQRAAGARQIQDSLNTGAGPGQRSKGVAYTTLIGWSVAEGVAHGTLGRERDRRKKCACWVGGWGGLYVYTDKAKHV